MRKMLFLVRLHLLQLFTLIGLSRLHSSIKSLVADAPALEDDGEGMDETQPVPDELVASTQIERGEMNQTAHSLWTAETAAPGALGKQVRSMNEGLSSILSFFSSVQS